MAFPDAESGIAERHKRAAATAVALPASGAKRMAWMMTVPETAKRHSHKATEIFYRFLTQPPNRVLEYLYTSGEH